MRWALALGAALGLLAGPAAADIVRVEAVGAVPASFETPGHPPPETPLLDAAVRAALAEAVGRVGVDVAAAGDPYVDPEAVAAALGSDPLPFAARYRVLEDRGERPALLVAEPGAASEYVVLVEAHVDRDRVRERLEEAGLLGFRREAGAAGSLVLVFEGLASYRGYRAVREALEARGATVVPREFARRRVAVTVDTPRPLEAVVETLRDDLRGRIALVPAGGGRDGTRRVLRATELQPPGERPSPAAGSGFDEVRRNRY